MSEKSTMALAEMLYQVDVTNGDLFAYVVETNGVLHGRGSTMEEGIRRSGFDVVYDLDRIRTGRAARLRRTGNVVLRIGVVCAQPEFCDNALWTWSRETAEIVALACRVATDAANRSKLDSGLR